MTKKPTHDELVERLHTPGWRLVTGEKDKSKAINGTLKDMLETTHDRKKRKEAPGLIKHIETTLELDAIQIEHHMQHMPLHRALRAREPDGDLLVGEPQRHEANDLAFAGRKDGVVLGVAGGVQVRDPQPE